MPTSAPTFFYFGQGCEIAKDYKNAERAYVQCVRIEPRYPGAFAALVRCHALQGHLDLAQSTVEEGLKHNPGDPELMRFRVQVAFDQNDHQRARAALLEIPEAQRDVDDLHNLVMLALEAENAAEAEPHARLAVKRAPDDWRAHWLLGLSLEGKEPMPRKDVIQAYEAAIARGDPQGEAATRLGLVLLQGDQADPDLAVEVLEDARARNPNHAGLLLHLALARANLGDRDQAKALADEVSAHANATAAEREQAERLREALSSS
jgi:Flp pilus assembly protein TadD